MVISIASSLLEMWAADCKLNAEACALLLGTIDGSEVTASGLISVRNVATLPGRFSVPHQDFLDAKAMALESGHSLVAFVHTHRGSTIPSAADIACMKLLTLPWIILDVGGFQSHRRQRQVSGSSSCGDRDGALAFIEAYRWYRGLVTVPIVLDGVAAVNERGGGL